MTKSDYKKWVDDNFTFLAISDAYSLIDYIFEKGFEAKTCDGCEFALYDEETNEYEYYHKSETCKGCIRGGHEDFYKIKESE